MMGFGREFRVTLFGTSHGPEVGVLVEGIPSGTEIDLSEIQREMDLRRPLGRRLASRRREPDRLRVDAGWSNGRSTGGPFRAHVANEDVRRSDYDRLRSIPRPGHADYPARVRYGESADLSGGGIFSGRMTVGLVIAGGIARQLLARRGVTIAAYTLAIGRVRRAAPETVDAGSISERAEATEVGAWDGRASTRMAEEIRSARREGDSVGGVVECRAWGMDVGTGEPFFDSVESELAHLAFSVPGVKGVEFGSGFRAARLRGSANNDPFYFDGSRIRTRTNHAGGLLGGLTTGEPIVMRVAVKPTSSIARRQESVDLVSRRTVSLVVPGRHDPCIVPRARVVIESVVAVGLVDLLLRRESGQ